VQVRRQEAHPATGGPRHALHRAEEPAHHPHTGIAQERVGPPEHAAVENYVLEVAALADRFEQRDRLPCDETAEQNVTRPNQRRRGGRVELFPPSGHPASSRIERNASGAARDAPACTRVSPLRKPRAEGSQQRESSSGVPGNFILSCRPQRGPSLARVEDMKDASSVDGNTLIWSLTGLIVVLVLGAMAYAVAIGIENLPRIGV
jgi:hypothetical protein